MNKTKPTRFAAVLALVASCGPPPEPAPAPPVTAPPPASAPAASAAAPASAPEVPGDAEPLEAEVRRDPIVDHCYWGMLAARLARDAYLAKLAPGEPNAKTTPVLLRGEGRPFSFERAARHCKGAVDATKQLPDASAEPLAAFAPVAVTTADTLVQLFACFGADCGKTDKFARAKKLTETLRSSQKEFDAQHDKLGAIVAVRAPARSKRASALLGEAELSTFYDHARELTALVAKNGIAADGRKPHVDGLSADLAALKAAASKGKTEIARIVERPAAGFIDIATKLGPAPLDEAGRIDLVDAFDTLGEVRLRALGRAVQMGGTRAPTAQ